jgi:O-acetylhomoserine (thiol)-lyase
MTKNTTDYYKGFDTLSVHGGTPPCPATGSRSMPIHQSSAFVFEDAQQASDFFALKKPGFIYSRLTNPTVSALEERLALLEGGTGATCTPSGLASHLLALFSIMRSGDNFIASQKLYGGTIGQFGHSFERAFGWKCHFADPTDPANFEKNIDEKTKAIFVESISNPEAVVVDIEAIAKIAEKHNLPLIVDNTVATPYICRPFEYGASIVTHSTTKYLSGHGNAMGGAVVDGGTFNWTAYADKFPDMAQPDPCYHGLNFAESFEDNAFAMHNHAVGLRDLGLNQQPMNAYITLMGMETLSLRMERHCANAQAVAEFLEGHEAVSWVNYPGLKSSPFYELTQKYHGGKGSALFTFGAKGGFEAGVGIVNSVKMFSHLANLGDTKSLIIHPASTTHSQLNEEQKEKAGCGPEVVRVSIGIENIEDIIADLDQALNIGLQRAAA